MNYKDFKKVHLKTTFFERNSGAIIVGIVISAIAGFGYTQEMNAIEQKISQTYDLNGIMKEKARLETATKIRNFMVFAFICLCGWFTYLYLSQGDKTKNADQNQ